ncbi:MAG: hypothetical protein BIFFINMI_03324 [Phycisphaerae bacterium]|nr:hypothetical protein [Phycisphaerae bacterium]
MTRFHQRILAQVLNLSSRISRRPSVRERDLRQADMGAAPPLAFDERLRDAFRSRWLRLKK